MAHRDKDRVEAALKYSNARASCTPGAIREVERETGFARATLNRWLRQFSEEIQAAQKENAPGSQQHEG